MDGIANRASGPVVFVDSSVIVALVDRDDASHAAALDAYRSLVADGYRFFTTNHVVEEAYVLLAISVGDAARQWLRDQRLAVYFVDDEDFRNAVARIAARPSGKPLSLTDALSLVVMERLDVQEAFAVDPAFLAELS
jgi:predicted nucleic acid-binding protein